MPVFNNILAGAAGQGGAAAGDVATKSLRFNSGDSAYLNRTPSSAGNRRTWTLSLWFKRSSSGNNEVLRANSSSTDHTRIYFANHKLHVRHIDGSTAKIMLQTSQVFRDFSGWTHCVVAVDTTAATNSDRVKLYINGSQVTDFGTETYPDQNLDTDVNATEAHAIGATTTGTQGFDGYFADCILVDGSQLDPTSFGAFDDSGVWQAAAYSGTFGTNGFHLNFADGSDLGADNSGNDNDFTPNNLVGTVDVADVSVASATGALPIYNTTDTYGATQGTGTRTDSDASSLVLAIPFLTNQNDVHATVKGSGSNKTVSGSGASASSTKDKFYGGSFRFDGSTATPMNVADSDDFTFDGDFTVEAWVWPDATNAFQIVTSKWDVGGQEFILAIDSNGKAEFHWAPYSDGGPAIESAAGVVNAKAWNHLAAVRSSGTITLYVNGTSVGTRSNNTAATNRSTLLTIGYLQYLGGSKLAGYLQDLRIYKGAAKYTSNFNPPSDPADKLPGEDLDLLFDVPTNGSTDDDTGAGGEVSGNYATLNPLEIGSNTTFSNGNLEVVSTNTSGWRSHCSTIAVSSGKYYFEADCSAGSVFSIGIADAADSIEDSYTTAGTPAYAYNYNGKKYSGGTSDDGAAGASYTAGDLIGVAFNLDDGEIEFFKNGTSQGTFYTNVDTTVSYKAVVSTRNSTIKVNFGQRAFAYSAPSGYKALCTTNLPTPTIADGSDYFDVKTWSGTGAENTLTGFEFSPDMIWVKRRNNSTDWHNITDTVRGATNTIYPNDTYVETVASQNVKAFTSDGVTLGTFGGVNASGGTYVGWTWDAGSSTVSNDNGSITSSVRANQTAGFSIVGWSGDNTNANKTVGHGLNASPEFIILKPRTEARHWLIWHKAIDNDEAFLFTTGTAAGSRFGPDAPTSSVFGVYGGQGNRGTTDFIAYCFAPVAGYSAFGSYTGNGNADGPFVFTGHLPRFVIIKRTDASGNDWQLYDTARSTFNEMDDKLKANTSGAEVVEHPIDFLSNGFKPRNTANGSNGSGATYIYASFASNPFQANGGLAR